MQRSLRRSPALEHPAVAPVADEAGRPFWSVMIPTRDRPALLARTLRGVLDQASGADEMEIEVVDNSTGPGAEALVRDVGAGRVRYHRQPAPVEMAVNWTTCVRRARGQWLHILHDDDVAMPGFYAAMRARIAARPDVVMVACRAIVIDDGDEWLDLSGRPPERGDGGVVPDAAARLVEGNFLAASACVVARRAYERVGAFSPTLAYTPDWEMWLRVARCGPVAFVAQPWVMCRAHAGGTTQSLFKSGRAIRDYVATVEAAAVALPPARARRARTVAYRRCASQIDHWRQYFHGTGDHRAALHQAWWAVGLSPSLGTVARVLKSTLRCLAGSVRAPRTGGA